MSSQGTEQRESSGGEWKPEKIMGIRHVNADLVAILERLLERAKTAEIVGISYVAELTDGSIGTGWTTRHKMTALGGVRWLEHRMMGDE